MTIIARLDLSDPISTTPIAGNRLLSPVPDLDLVACIRALDGWVAPDGLAPRWMLERLVEQGRLEAWPGRPLYRAPRIAPGSRA